MSVLQRLILFAYVTQLCVCSDSANLQLTVIVPQQNTNGPSAAWERGLEILPGAQVALKMINKNNDILSGYSLTIRNVSSMDCNKEMFVFIEHLVMSHYRQEIAGVVKQFCSNAIRISVGSIQQNEIASFVPQYKYKGKLIEALLSMMEQMDWRHVGVITEISNTFFLYIAETFYKASKDNSRINVISFTQLYKNEWINIHQQPKVIFVSVSAATAIEILCQVYENEQQWPKRAWILHSYWLKDFLDYSKYSRCDLEKAIQGVILVRERLEPVDDNFTLHSGVSYTKYWQQYETELSVLSKLYNISHLQPNPYANALHDAVWIAALALNKSNNGTVNCNRTVTHCLNTVSFAGAQGQVDISKDGSVLRPIEIVHIKGYREVFVGQYKLNLTNINMSFINEAPSDNIPIYVVGGSTAYTVGLTVEIVITFLVVTSFLILYIFFRNEPEIKSTSLALSSFIYLGCYLTLIYLILLLIFDQPSQTLDNSYYETLCTLLQWTSGLGIPVPLIVGTTLIKIIRIYYIFHNFSSTGPAPVGKQCSDIFLAFLVLLTISPSVLILIIWTIVDHYTLTVRYSPPRDGYIAVSKQCTSTNLAIWIGSWILCILFQLFALLIVAIKTRKIRLKHYKDTKKVNVFIFLLHLNLFFTISYWYFLRDITIRHITDIVSHIGHSLLVIFCQAFLFAPKILPPLCRRVSRNVKRSPELELSPDRDFN